MTSAVTIVFRTPSGRQCRAWERPISTPTQRRLSSDTCASQVRAPSNTTPRFFACVHGCNSASRNEILKSGKVLRFWRLPKTISCVLAVLIFRPWARNQTLSLKGCERSLHARDEAPEVVSRTTHQYLSVIGVLEGDGVSRVKWQVVGKYCEQQGTERRALRHSWCWGVVATTPYVWICRTGTHSACTPGDSQRTRRSQCRAFLVLWSEVRDWSRRSICWDY